MLLQYKLILLFIKDLQKRNGINELYDQIAHEKVLVFLENNAVITDVPAAEVKAV